MAGVPQMAQEEQLHNMEAQVYKEKWLQPLGRREGAWQLICLGHLSASTFGWNTAVI